MIKFNYDNSSIDDKMINAYSKKVAQIHNSLNEIANDEKEYVGWLELPTNYDKEEFARILDTSNHIDPYHLMLIVVKGNNMMSLVHELYRRAADEA